MRPSGRMSDAELHAYVDGQLGPERAREVANWLGGHPTDAHRVDLWRAQNEAIRHAFPTPPREKPPIPLRQAVAEQGAPPIVAPRAPNLGAYRARQRRRTALATSLAFATGAIAAGALALVVQRLGAESHQATPVMVVAAVDTYPARLAISAWRAYAEDRQRPVDFAAKDRGLAVWLMERAGLARVPETSGARLLGARVLPGRVTNAAFLLYETGDGERLALTAERAGATPPAPAAEGDLHAAVWRAGGFDYGLAGKLSEVRLKAFADGFAGSTGPK